MSNNTTNYQQKLAAVEQELNDLYNRNDDLTDQLNDAYERNGQLADHVAHAEDENNYLMRREAELMATVARLARSNENLKARVLALGGELTEEEKAESEAARGVPGHRGEELGNLDVEVEQELLKEVEKMEQEMREEEVVEGLENMDLGERMEE